MFWLLVKHDVFPCALTAVAGSKHQGEAGQGTTGSARSTVLECS
jgi:hypothetical protein